LARALVLAAGRGERLGATGPKAFAELAGRPLLQWSVDVMRAVAGLEEIVVALPPGVPAPAGTTGVEGGAVRSASVRRALQAAAAGGPDEAIVVHDAARPLVTVELVERVLTALAGDESVDAAIAAAPVSDTIKRVEGDLVVETLDRRELWAVQTPQVFRRAALERSLNVPDEVLTAATDDAWLVERAGGKIAVVPSASENLKVTTPLDLRLAELLLTRAA
jgi:2-C-methyl-D-erythritol 4-phosphate cytidylyltransferase